MKVYYSKNKKVYEFETLTEEETNYYKEQKSKQLLARSFQDKKIEYERRREKQNGICPHCYCLLPASRICNCQ